MSSDSESDGNFNGFFVRDVWKLPHRPGNPADAEWIRTWRATRPNLEGVGGRQRSFDEVWASILRLAQLTRKHP